MKPPTIYNISDRAPEFPCWLWSLLENEWQQREHLIGDVDTLYDFTHWCHSAARPTVTPDAGSKLAASEARHADAQTAIRNGLEREDALKAQLAAAQEDTKRLAEVVLWALGERDEFPMWPDSVEIKGREKFWWRRELRRRFESARAKEDTRHA